MSEDSDIHHEELRAGQVWERVYKDGEGRNILDPVIEAVVRECGHDLALLITVVTNTVGAILSPYLQAYDGADPSHTEQRRALASAVGELAANIIATPITEESFVRIDGLEGPARKLEDQGFHFPHGAISEGPRTQSMLVDADPEVRAVGRLMASGCLDLFGKWATGEARRIRDLAKPGQDVGAEVRLLGVIGIGHMAALLVHSSSPRHAIPTRAEAAPVIELLAEAIRKRVDDIAEERRQGARAVYV